MIKQRSTLKPSMFGNPRVVVGEDSPQSVYLGKLAGIVMGLTEASTPTGEVFEGLSGNFAFVSANKKDGESIQTRSTRLFLPGGFIDDLLELMRQNREESREQNKKGLGSKLITVKVAWDIWSVKSSSPAGYAWEFRPLLKPAVDDPLQSMLSEIGIIEGQSVTAQPLLDAPSEELGTTNTEPDVEFPDAGLEPIEHHTKKKRS